MNHHGHHISSPSGLDFPKGYIIYDLYNWSAQCRYHGILIQALSLSTLHILGKTHSCLRLFSPCQHISLTPKRLPRRTWYVRKPNQNLPPWLSPSETNQHGRDLIAPSKYIDYGIHHTVRSACGPHSTWDYPLWLQHIPSRHRGIGGVLRGCRI